MTIFTGRRSFVNVNVSRNMYFQFEQYDQFAFMLSVECGYLPFAIHAEKDLLML